MAPVILGILGVVFGGILAYASKVFAVEKDPREEEIAAILPGANCGGCGYPGCSGFASAVVKGVAPVNACTPGGAELAQMIGKIMGVEAEIGPKRVAQVLCSGHGCEKLRYDYVGLQDCRAMSKVSAGPLQCLYGCLGGGTCEEVCQFNAIHVVDGVAVVDHEACVACNQCVEVCPRNLIQMIPLKTKRHVAVNCNSKAKGAEVRKSCDDGCIGCGICVKVCPKEGAIYMEDNLARINYDLCIGCGICAQNCPRKTITIDGKVPEAKPKMDKKDAPLASAKNTPSDAAKDGELETPGKKAEKARETMTAPMSDGTRSSPIDKNNDTPAEMLQKKAERFAQKKITDPKIEDPKVDDE
jgi:Na+-translocating ferredoxin:NAD+ oxidoreductase RNF subunit RnfB